MGVLPYVCTPQGKDHVTVLIVWTCVLLVLLIAGTASAQVSHEGCAHFFLFRFTDCKNPANDVDVTDWDPGETCDAYKGHLQASGGGAISSILVTITLLGTLCLVRFSEEGTSTQGTLQRVLIGLMLLLSCAMMVVWALIASFYTQPLCTTPGSVPLARAGGWTYGEGFTFYVVCWTFHVLHVFAFVVLACIPPSDEDDDDSEPTTISVQPVKVTIPDSPLHPRASPADVAQPKQRAAADAKGDQQHRPEKQREERPEERREERREGRRERRPEERREGRRERRHRRRREGRPEDASNPLDATSPLAPLAQSDFSWQPSLPATTYYPQQPQQHHGYHGVVPAGGYVMAVSPSHAAPPPLQFYSTPPQFQFQPPPSWQGSVGSETSSLEVSPRNQSPQPGLNTGYSGSSGGISPTQSGGISNGMSFGSGGGISPTHAGAHGGGAGYHPQIARVVPTQMMNNTPPQSFLAPPGQNFLPCGHLEMCLQKLDNGQVICTRCYDNQAGGGS